MRGDQESMGRAMRATWFRAAHLKPHARIVVDDMVGLCLPHAGTLHCGSVLSHALRFAPSRPPARFVLLYVPAQSVPDADAEAPAWVPAEHRHHEVVVPLRAVLHLWPELAEAGKARWHFHDASSTKRAPSPRGAFVVVSCDGSHHMSFVEARRLEDAAAAAVGHGSFEAVDRRALDALAAFRIGTPNGHSWQWVGRSRSRGERGVGYLAFLLRRLPRTFQRVRGVFVTAYGPDFHTRECLGEFGEVTAATVTALAQRVRRRASGAHPRLAPSRGALPSARVRLTVALLTPSRRGVFVRGWHAIRACGATFLSVVFLEHTDESGAWIGARAASWPPRAQGVPFDLAPTFQRLRNKSGGGCDGDASLFDTQTYPLRLKPSTAPRARAVVPSK